MTSEALDSAVPVKTLANNSGSLNQIKVSRSLTCGPISVVIPTLNEVANISILLTQLDQTLTGVGVPYEAIVVDDHSTDGTAESVADLAKKENLPVRILIKQGQRGKSFSLIEGFAAARFDVLAMMDGDLQYSPESLLDMLYHLEDADMVLADRRIGRCRSIYRLRDLLSQAFTFIICTLFGIDSDIQSGLKVFRRKVYQDITIHPSQWTFELHLITHAARSGYLITNMPVVPNERHAGASKVSPVAVGMELMIEAFRLKLSLVTRRVPIHKV